MNWRRHFSLLAYVESLGREMRSNPYWNRAFGKRSWTKLLAGLGIVALVSFGLTMAVATPGSPTIVASRIPTFSIYLGLRIVMLACASFSATRAARREVLPGNVEHLHLCALTPRQLSLGWAMMGSNGAIPVTLMTFAVFYPWLHPEGLKGWLLPWLDLAQVILLQGLAALVAANLTLKFSQRREATSAGWISAVFTYPLVFFLRAMLVLSVLLIIPAIQMAKFDYSGILTDPHHMAPHFIRNHGRDFVLHFGYWIEVIAYPAYFIGIPLGALYEIRRQLEIADQYGREFRSYFESNNK